MTLLEGRIILIFTLEPYLDDLTSLAEKVPKACPRVMCPKSPQVMERLTHFADATARTIEFLNESLPNRLL